MKTHQYFVYILTNMNRTLYIGVTNNIIVRLAQHKAKDVPGFTAKYGIDMLIYVESYTQIEEAIAREKQLKNWSRSKKITLIERVNPNWEELVPG